MLELCTTDFKVTFWDFNWKLVTLSRKPFLAIKLNALSCCLGVVLIRDSFESLR